jgi:hypothetical protein
MGIVNLDAENVIYEIVEAMLPRFSDRKLGLLIGVDFNITDMGYAPDGNTRERKEKSVRERYYFLFVRPSNYTKVFLWKPKDTKNRFANSPRWNGEGNWELLSDHDSCWREGFSSELTDFYFRATDEFNGRIKGGKPMTNNDLFRLIALDSQPEYMFLDVFEQRDKMADRFSTEGRVWNITIKPLTFAKLEMPESPDKKQLGQHGLLVKGSEDHKQYIDLVEIYKKRIDEGITI